MDQQIPAAAPTATSLKNELRESLKVLTGDFESLRRFVTELVCDGVAAPISLTKEDLRDLLSVTLEIRDAACNIEFEADKIREILDRVVV